MHACIEVHDQAEPRRCLLAVSRALTEHRLSPEIWLCQVILRIGIIQMSVNGMIQRIDMFLQALSQGLN